MIKEAVGKDAYLIRQSEGWVEQPNGTPFFNVDVTLLESTASLKYEVLNDLVLCREVDELRFELVRLSRKVELLLKLEFDSTARMAIDHPQGSHYNIQRPRLVEAIRVQTKPIGESLRRLEAKL